VLSQFLAELDGIEELKGILVLGATNRADMLDPAVLRPGRFDEVIEIPTPEEKDREDIFRVHLRNKPLEEGVDPSDLAARSEGFSGAEIASVCNRAALMAVRRAVASLKENPDENIEMIVRHADIEAALTELSDD
jgi:transitional endoplasmic reticulum ATPase